MRPIIQCLTFQLCCLMSFNALADSKATLLEAITNIGASRFLELVNRTGQIGNLTQKEPVTVFVPTNEAFDNLPDEQKDNLNDPAFAKGLVQYHMTHGRHPRDTFYNDALYRSGYKAEEEDKPEDVRINIYQNGQNVTATGAVIESFDHEASNGIVHVLSRVMYYQPNGGSVARLMFLPILRYMGYGIVDGGVAEMLDKKGPFTIFAPTDLAFESLPNKTLNLLNGNKTAIKRVMLNQVVSGSLYTAGLTEGDSFMTLLGEKLTVDSIEGNITVSGADLLLYDIPGTNGVVHITNKVFFPKDHS